MTTGSRILYGRLSSCEGLFISKVKKRRMREFSLFNRRHSAGGELNFTCIHLVRHIFTVESERASCSTSYLQETVGTGNPDLFSKCSLLPGSDLVSLLDEREWFIVHGNSRCEEPSAAVH